MNILNDLETSLVKREPVMVHAFVMWLLSNVGLVVIGHTHLVTTAQWGATATYLTPMISAVVITLLNKVLREQVKPAKAGAIASSTVIDDGSLAPPTTPDPLADDIPSEDLRALLDTSDTATGNTGPVPG